MVVSGGESTLGDLECHDVAAAVGVARERCEVVVVVGASMGAIAALRHAAGDDCIAGTVLVSCPAAWRLPRNVQGVAAAVLTRTALGRLLARRLLGLRIASDWNNPEPPVDLAPRVRSPLAILHGDADAFIPASDAVELQSRTTTGVVYGSFRRWATRSSPHPFPRSSTRCGGSSPPPVATA